MCLVLFDFLLLVIVIIGCWVFDDFVFVELFFMFGRNCEKKYDIVNIKLD